MPQMVVYTKRGDSGKTSLLGNKRILKSSKIVSALGTLDEVNSYLGIIITDSKDKILNNILLQIQRDLFGIAAIIAGAKSEFDKNNVKKLETIIDQNKKKLPPLKNFILPGGTKISAELMYIRAITRTAEREFVGIYGRLKVKNKKEVLEYLNRLSDVFFTLARRNNFKNKFEERKWRNPK